MCSIMPSRSVLDFLPKLFRSEFPGSFDLGLSVHEACTVRLSGLVLAVDSFRLDQQAPRPSISSLTVIAAVMTESIAEASHADQNTRMAVERGKSLVRDDC